MDKRILTEEDIEKIDDMSFDELMNAEFVCDTCGSFDMTRGDDNE